MSLMLILRRNSRLPHVRTQDDRGFLNLSGGGNWSASLAELQSSTGHENDLDVGGVLVT
jgi:hypothetical protein